MKNNYCIVFMLVLGVSQVLVAQNTLDYVEGLLEIKEGSSWNELGIGDELPSDASLRLSENGYAEIITGHAVVSLMVDGNYELQALVDSAAGLTTREIDLKKKLCLNSGYERWQQEAAMGVRGTAQESEKSIEMVDAYTYLKEGLQSLSEGNYEEAEQKFREGWDFFNDHNCLFYTAVCYEMEGQKGRSVRTLKNVNPSSLYEEFYPDYALRVGDLYLRSLSFDQAVEVLGCALSKPSSLDEKQSLYFLMGQGYLGMDDHAKAENAFAQSRQIDPASETGRLAAKVLQDL